MAESMAEQLARAMYRRLEEMGGTPDDYGADEQTVEEFMQMARAALATMRAEIAKYDDQIAGKHADGSYYCREDAVHDDGRQRALDDILAIFDAALATDSAAASRKSQEAG